MDVLYILLGVLVVLLVWWYVLIAPPEGLPPGLPRLPLVGSLPFLSTTNLLWQLLDFKDRFGPVFTIYMANRPAVYLNTMAAIRECLSEKGENFMQRPYLYNLTEALSCNTGKNSFASSSGEEHKVMRHFTQTVLVKQFGMGKRGFQENIMTELKYLLEEIDKFDGKPFDIFTWLGVGTSNIVNNVLYGHRLDYTDKMFQQQIQGLHDECKLIEGSQILNVYPWLRHFGISQEKMVTTRNEFKKSFWGMIMDRYRDTTDRDSFMNTWLAKIEEDKQNGVKDSVFNGVQMRLVMQDLFSGGAETSKSVLYDTLAHLLHDPSLLAQLQEMIDNVIGSRDVTMDDKDKLSLVDAVILETLRMSPPLPLAVPHTNSHDDTVAGFRIPAGTMVFANLHAAHHDPSLWDEPRKFKPQRFLMENGQIDGEKKHNIIPFGIGRRVCPGEALSRMELFLVLTSLLQRYTFTLPPGDQPPSLELKLGLTLSIKRYEICAERRL